MIAILRRIFVIIFIFGILFLTGILNNAFIANISTNLLAILGFSVLVSFAAGEIFSYLKLPKIIGYLLVGILFGPYVFQNIEFLNIFSIKSLTDLKVVSNITLSLIAFSAGLELQLSTFKNTYKTISAILFFKILFLIILFISATLICWDLIPFLKNYSLAQIIWTGIFISIVAYSTSTEITMVTLKDANAKGKLAETLLNLAVVKDLFIIIFLAIALSLFPIFNTADMQVDSSIFLSILGDLALSIGLGAILGTTLIFYAKKSQADLILFIFVLVVLGTHLSSIFGLDNLLIFLASGFVITNFSQFGETYIKPLQKISLPIIVIFFTLSGASLDFNLMLPALALGIVLVIMRLAAYYFATKLSCKLFNEDEIIKKYAWMGTFSLGALSLGVGNILADNVGSFGKDLQSIIGTFVGVYIFLGPIILKLSLEKAKLFSSNEESTILQEKPERKPLPKEIIQNRIVKFKEANFADDNLNRYLDEILLKLNSILSNFENKFIINRTEESIELLLTISEKYSDDYQKFKKNITESKKTSQDINQSLLTTKKELVESYIKIFQERASTEKEILKLEELIKNLFYSLSDLAESLPESMEIIIDPLKLKSKKNDGIKQFFYKFIYVTKLKFNRIFKKNYQLRRTIELRNIVKYYLIGTSSNEILETINLVGLERLNTLKQLRRLFNDYCEYLDEIINFAIDEKNNIALNMLILEKAEEKHKEFVNELNVYINEVSNTTNEIGKRLNYALINPYNNLIDFLDSLYEKDFSNLRYKYSKVFEKSENEKEFTLESIRYWVNYYLGILGLAKKDGNMQLIRTQLNLISHNSLLAISNEINTNLRDVIKELLKVLKIFLKEVNTIKEDIPRLREFINNNTKIALLNTLDAHIVNLETVRKSKRFNYTIEEVINDLKNISSFLPETIYILNEKDINFIDRKPIYKELKVINFKAYVTSYIDKILPREMSDLNELLINHLNFTLIELKNIYSIILYHINTSANELNTDDTNRINLAIEIINSLVDKLNTRFNQINNQIDTLENDIHTHISETVNNSINNISSQLYHQTGKIENIVNQNSELINKLSVSISEKIKNNYRKFSIINKRFYNKNIKPLINYLFSNYVIKNNDPSDNNKVNIIIKEKIEQLPFIYKKVFDGTPLESSRVLYDNPKVFSDIEKIIKNFFNNQRASILITGEPGSGKSSFINSLKAKILKDIEFLNYQLNKTITSREELLEVLNKVLNLKKQTNLEELIISLNDKSNKKVIFLENTGKLFLRKINGYEALQTLIYIISQTSRNTLWICSISKQPYDFLTHHFNFNSCFELEISTHNLFTNNIKKIILNRHEITGYNLKYIPDKLTKLKENYFTSSKIEKNNNYYEDIYFNKLLNFAKGNIISAMFFWLYSIHRIKENELMIKIPDTIEFDVLSDYSELHLMTLSSLLTHSWLTDIEHSQIFNIPVTKSREIFEFLINQNLVYIDQLEVKSNKFFINKFLYRIIINELTKRNILIL